MFKTRFHISIVLCFMIFCISLISCNKTHDVIEGTVIDILPTKYNAQTIDYTQYLKKIWVVEDWDGGAYFYPSSFRITRIENGIIEGTMVTGEIAEPLFYSHYYASGDLGSPHLPNFDDIKDLSQTNLLGAINSNVANCKFSDLDGNMGNATLLFKSDYEIEAKIEYLKKKYDYEKESSDGKYVFRAYNLSDIQSIDPFKKRSFEIELDSWGNVNLVTVVITGNKPYPAAFLTNDNNDILYVFSAPYQIGGKIINASIVDVNRDGLKDVQMTTAFYDYTTDTISDYDMMEWLFLQMDNGLFYDSRLAPN